MLNRAEPPPFPLSDRADDVDEVLRLRHRYLDLRRPSMQRNLRLRASVNHAIRESMLDQGFVEVETPMLIASTPEGARDFVVPSRLSPGEFYALPQSPQLFKQLLMVGGFDRYFQIARCLRDEDLRGDRQFEFMQYDMEMSFADQADVIAVVTRAVNAAVEAVTGAPLAEIPHMTWAEAMERFGTDKPDLRFGMELVDLGAAVAAHRVQGVPRRGGQGHLRPRTRRRVPVHARRARRPGQAARCRRARVDARAGRWRARVAGREVPRPRRSSRRSSPRSGATAATSCSSWPGRGRSTNAVLGALRLDLGRPPVGEGGLVPLWVVDFPLFEAIDADGHPDPGAPSVHPAAPRRPRAAAHRNR